MAKIGEELRHYQMLIAGRWKDASDGRRFDSINPATGRCWATMPEATTKDVDEAVRAADIAFRGWSKMAPTARGHCLRKLADLLAEHSQTLGRIETIDTGKLYRETQWQARYVADYFYFYAGCADKISGETLPIDKPDMFAFTRREPIGVVAAVVPWNSQLFLSATKIGPALAAGNTIVIKASEHAAAVLLEFGTLIEQSGIPPGVVNIVTGHGEPCGKALTSHPIVARISFTGGAESAHHIVHNSAQNFAQLSLELGGKSPIIVFADAHFESAVNGTLGGAFGASGQSCVSGSRLYVQDSIADDFLAQLVAKARQIRVGSPLDEDVDMGPLCTQRQLDCIEEEVAFARQQGGNILFGGQRTASLEGFYYQPTIIECQQSMRIVDTELFGPVLSVLRFSDESQAIDLANSSAHGLAAGIFSSDSARSIRVSESLRSGIVWVNTYRVISPIAAFGGVKRSGYGRESGFQAVYDYTRPKTVWINTSDRVLNNQFITK